MIWKSAFIIIKGRKRGGAFKRGVGGGWGGDALMHILTSYPTLHHSRILGWTSKYTRKCFAENFKITHLRLPQIVPLSFRTFFAGVIESSFRMVISWNIIHLASSFRYSWINLYLWVNLLDYFNHFVELWSHHYM